MRDPRNGSELFGGNANDERLRVGVEYFAARKSDFATEEELREQLSAALPEHVDLQTLLDQLSEPENVREATAFVASELLADENDGDSLREDIQQASDKLAVIETALGVLLILYAIHYVATGGVSSIDETRRLPDGTYVKRSIKYQQPTEWINAVVKLFGFSGKGDS